MANRILAVDPSGTGTTGIYLKNNQVEEFQEYKDKEWQNTKSLQLHSRTSKISSA